MTALQVVQKFYPKVLAVKDASRALEIEVLPKDVNKDAVKNHKACAIAEACKRSYQIDGAVIAVKTAYLVKGKAATRYTVPEYLSREIVSFDRTGAFAPGSYALNKPTHKLGRKGGTARNRTGNGKPVQYRHATQGIRSVYAPV